MEIWAPAPPFGGGVRRSTEPFPRSTGPRSTLQVHDLLGPAHDRVILQGVLQKLKYVQHVDLLGKVEDIGMILVFIILIDTIFINN